MKILAGMSVAAAVLLARIQQGRTGSRSHVYKVFRGVPFKGKHSGAGRRGVTDAGWYGAGEYWTSQYSTALFYAHHDPDGVQEAELQFENPLFLTYAEADTLAAEYGTKDPAIPYWDRHASAQRLSSDLAEQGYDGLVIEDGRQILALPKPQGSANKGRQSLSVGCQDEIIAHYPGAEANTERCPSGDTVKDWPLSKRDRYYKRNGVYFWGPVSIELRAGFVEDVVSVLQRDLPKTLYKKNKHRSGRDMDGKYESRGPIWHQIDAPILTPDELVSTQYDRDRMYETRDDLVLRPQTTPGSYALAREISLCSFNDFMASYLRGCTSGRSVVHRSTRHNYQDEVRKRNLKGKRGGVSEENAWAVPITYRWNMPFVIWQHGKSFRREQTKTRKHQRLKEFHQLEIQIFDLYEQFQSKEVMQVIQSVKRVIQHYVGRCKIEDAKAPSYAEWTKDIVLSKTGMELASISLRTDFDLRVEGGDPYWKGAMPEHRYPDRDGPYQPVVLEIAIGTDRIVLNAKASIMKDIDRGRSGWRYGKKKKRRASK